MGLFSSFGLLPKRALLATLGGSGLVISALLHSTFLSHVTRDSLLRGDVSMTSLVDGLSLDGSGTAAEATATFNMWQKEMEEERAEHSLLTSIDNVIPLRSPEEMKHTQACFRQHQGFGYLVHMRKAGGTSLRTMFSEMVRRSKTGGGGKRRGHVIYVSEGETFNTSCFRHQGELLTITSLRDPIDRIISSYWFEGRYPLGKGPKKTNETVGGGAEEGDDSGVPQPIGFATYMDQVRKEEMDRRKEFAIRRVWMSADNYYIKTLTNRYRDNLNAPVTRKEFELARRILASFDLVIIMEWMNYEKQTAYINRVLNEPIGKIVHSNRKERDETEIDEDDIKELRRLNHWDILLYEYARTLVEARMMASEEEEEQQQNGGDVVGAIDCRVPINDPYYRKDTNKPIEKPNRDSFLYTVPFCTRIDDFEAHLIRDVW